MFNNNSTLLLIALSITNPAHADLATAPILKVAGQWKRKITMKTQKLLITALLISTPVVCAAVPFVDSNTPPDKSKFTAALANITVPFAENRGQADAKVAFQAKTLAGSLFVTTDGELVWSLNAPSPLVGEGRDGGKFKAKVSSPPTLTLPHKGGGNLHQEFVGPPAPTYSVVEKFVGGTPKPTGKTVATTQVNYFHGNDKSKWHSGVPTWQQVSLGEVWPGIEVSVAARGKNAEKLFTVAPGADVSKIAVEIAGGSLEVAADGGLRVHAPSPLVGEGRDGGKGLITFTAPVAYQLINGERKAVQVAYQIKDLTGFKNLSGLENVYGFTLGHHDSTQPVIIDPLLQATYLGGSGGDWINAIAVTADAVYVAGSTRSSDFPGTSSGAQASIGGGTCHDGPCNEGFIAKFNLDLTTLIQASYLGGNDWEDAYAIAVTNNAVYVAGQTHSTNFPGTSGGALASFGGSYSDGFVAKLSLDLTTLTQASYLGGSGFDWAYALAVTSNAVYVAGYTTGSFPGVSGGAQASKAGGNDAFVAKLNLDLTTLIQASYLGGGGNEEANAIAVTSSAVYVAGYTHSSNFPGTNGGAQASNAGSDDAFVAKLSLDLKSLTQASYLGGSGTDYGYALAVSSSAVYVSGMTSSSNFPGTSGGAQASFGGVSFDAFIAKLNLNLTTLNQASFLGGNSWDEARALAVTSSAVYVAGKPGSSDFPGVSGGAQSSNSGGNAFIAKLNLDLTTLNQASFLGGNGWERAVDLAVTSSAVYVAGSTGSSNFPGTNGGAQAVIEGEACGTSPDTYPCADGFIAKLTPDLQAAAVISVPTVTTTAATNLTPTTATLNGSVTSNGATANVNFNFGTTTAYGQTIAAVPAQINSNTAVAVTGAATGLTCNTTYHYKITAVNSAGTTNGTDQSFTTATCPGPTVNPPTVVSGNPTNITPTSATLNGMVNSNNADTTVTFEYGINTNYGSSINANPNTVNANAGNTNVAANLTGLTCQTVYHYRVKATNSAGTSHGNDQMFDTFNCQNEDKHARALIIGGFVQRDDATTLNNIMQTMQQAYSALGKQGYQNANNKEFIRVLWNGPAIRFPSGGFVPTEATDVSNFTSNTELTQWAQQASRLLIYMIGHGDTNIFYFDDNADQILTIDIMKTWLGLVQPKTRAVPSDNELIFIYEACRSGSFLKPLADLNRIIMTSTTDNQQAMLLDNNSYSYGLWTMLGNGKDMKESLQRATLELGNRLQNPQLDATGDGQSDEITSVDKFCIGIKPNGMRGCISTLDLPPEIEDARQTTLNGENSANLWLKISANQAVNVDDNWKAWAVINPPNFQPESSHGFYQLPTVTLTKDATKQKWSGDYNQFNTVGTYTISYYIQNNDGPSKPLVKNVTQFGGSSTQANLESPQQGSYESGIGLIRGWACQANTIEIQIDNGTKRQVAYGTARGDTQTTCGHSNTGFGFTYNWNALSNGTHNLKVFADNVQFADVNFTTTNLGSNYLTGASGQHTVSNFPSTDKTATLKWSEPHQNFVIASATRTTPKIMPPVIRPDITGNLESPQQNSFESGIGLIRGWVCQANSIELQIDNGTRRPVAYGTARGDTAATCNGNPNTGFGYVYNWNALNDGTHNLRLFLNNQEFTNVNFTVTTLGGNYLEGLNRDETFNFNGRNIKVRWATPHQNFVIVP